MSTTMAGSIRIDSRDGIFPLVCCSLMMLSVSAGYKAQAVFYYAFLEELGFSNEEASWPLTIYQFSMNFSGLILGPLFQWCSFRLVTVVSAAIGSLGFFLAYFVKDVVVSNNHAVYPLETFLCLTFGLMGGLSFGAVLLASSVIVTQYFEKYRAVTLGIAFSGAAVGSFIYPNLLTLLDKKLGIHGMIACNGAICLVSVPLALCLKEIKTNSPSDTVDNKKSAPEYPVWKQFSVLFEPLFWVIMMPIAWYAWANSVCLSVLIDYTKSKKGFSDWEAVNLLTFFGVTEIVGLFVLPQICDHGFILRESLMLLGYALGGVLLLVIPFCKTYIASVISICVFGSFYGLSASFYRCFVGDYLGFHRMKLAFGIIVTIKGVVVLTVPPFIGYIKDVLHNYEIAFILSGAGLTAISVLWIPAIYKKKTSKLKLQSIIYTVSR